MAFTSWLQGLTEVLGRSSRVQHHERDNPGSHDSHTVNCDEILPPSHVSI